MSQRITQAAAPPLKPAKPGTKFVRHALFMDQFLKFERREYAALSIKSNET